MIGQKGLPATFGGVEHHVEQLGTRLAALGHEVVVYTRPSYSDPGLSAYKGIQLRSRPSIATKHLDAITHSFLSSLDSRRQPFDIVHYHAIGPCLTAPLARRRDRHLVATVHGQDWRRAKWNPLARLALQTAENMALNTPDATIVVSKTLSDFYKAEGAQSVHYIPNGVATTREDDPGFVASLGVDSGEYAVYVGRLVPEKGAHDLIAAWRCLNTSKKLVIVGGASFTDDYVRGLHGAGGDVIFTGYLYGAQLASVFRHAGLFVLPSLLEGLPIVLLESLAYGTPVLASDITPNREVLGDQGDYFRAGDVDDLALRLSQLLPRMRELKTRTAELQQRVTHEYDWDRVTEATVALYASLLV